MLSTITYQPKSILEEFAECIYVNRSDNFEYSGLSFPTLNQELFFNFGDSFELKNPVSKAKNKRYWLCGAQIYTSNVNTTGKHFTAGVIFKPWGLYCGFGINGKLVANNQIDIEAIFKNLSLKEIKENQNNLSEDEFIKWLEDLLIKSLNPKRLTKTMAAIVKGLSMDDVDALPGELQLSKKTIIESFNNLLGITPTKYLHLKAVNESIEILTNKSNKKLTDLTYELGFYDQAHFIKVFKTYTGLTPGEFKKYVSIQT
ncbi:MAG: helix-turn-helix domain-containing protein [Bacteroidota bacterium]|nr:helix-turn-helix domain-containing protein [Bacteroidota bacterium]